VGVGIDPLAADYKSLFPKFQNSAMTVAAAGEHLPFADESFDVVLSDNVIDHAERPLSIVDEMVRVLRRGGIFYFTVNVHHAIYDLASRAHGAWNAVGIKIELSAFADHTVHLTEARISEHLRKTGLSVVEERSNVDETRREQRAARGFDPDSLLKRLFFKNALYELIAVRK
jgi:SAM-dependent methyltransferase